MATVALTGTTAREVIAAAQTGRAVWFQNFNTAADIYLKPRPSDSPAAEAAAGEFLLPRATAATVPSVLIIQASGGDTTLVRAAWRALCASSVDLQCGRW